MIGAIARQLAAVRAAPAAEPLRHRLRICQSVIRGCWSGMCRPTSPDNVLTGPATVHTDASPPLPPCIPSPPCQRHSRWHRGRARGALPSSKEEAGAHHGRRLWQRRGRPPRQGELAAAHRPLQPPAAGAAIHRGAPRAGALRR